MRTRAVAAWAFTLACSSCVATVSGHLRASTASLLSEPAPADDVRINRPNDPYQALENDVHESALRAMASASDARSVASETQGRASQEATLVSDYTAKALAERTARQLPFLEDATTEAAKQQLLAADGAVGAAQAFRSTELMQGEAVSNAAAYASATVADRLTDTYMGFQEWKMAVLHDPMMESKRAAQKAVAPFRKKLNFLHNKIINYQDRAKDLQNQGFALQSAGAATAKFAVGLQGAGVIGPAAANMEAAHHMIYQAGVFMTNSAKVNFQAQMASLAWGDLQKATTQVMAETAHRYAPSLVAPPPVDASLPSA